MDKQLLETTTSNIFITLMIVLFALAFLAPLFKLKKVRREIESITKQENHVDVLSALMFKAGLSLSFAIKFAVGGIIAAIVFLEFGNQFPQLSLLFILGISICLLTIYIVVDQLTRASLYLKGARQKEV